MFASRATLQARSSTGPAPSTSPLTREMYPRPMQAAARLYGLSSPSAMATAWRPAATPSSNSPSSARQRASQARLIALYASQDPTTVPRTPCGDCTTAQQLRSAPIVAEGVTRQAKIVSGVELERDVLQLVTQDQRLLREPSRLGGLSCLAEVFADLDRHQSEPACIRDFAGHGLGFSQVGQHLLELTERVQRAAELKPYIDLLLPRAGRLGQVSQRFQRLVEKGQRFAVRRSLLGLRPGLPQVRHGLVPHLTTVRMMGQPLHVLGQAVRIALLDGLDDARVKRAAPRLQEAGVRDFNGQSLLERVHSLGHGARLLNKLHILWDVMSP